MQQLCKFAHKVFVKSHEGQHNTQDTEQLQAQNALGADKLIRGKEIKTESTWPAPNSGETKLNTSKVLHFKPRYMPWCLATFSKHIHK